MEMPLTILLIPVAGVLVLALWGFYRACKPYWDEQDRLRKEAEERELHDKAAKAHHT